MAVYSGNRPNRTLTVHKPGCHMANRGPAGCGCGDTGEGGNQRWWWEEH